MVIRTAIDALFQRHLSRTGPALDRCAQELTDIFDHYTQPAAEQAQKVLP
ncbi:hypothetical protein [Streptomyces sp. TRM68367]|nr:hypothetical protein [Streptomyces sp. TRM68367]